MGNSIGSKLGAKSREMLEHKSCQVTIFTQREQVLLVECVDIWFGVFFDDAVGDDNWPALVCRPNAIHGETTRQTSDRAKQRFESLRQMVRDVVFIDLSQDEHKVKGEDESTYLDHCPP